MPPPVEGEGEAAGAPAAAASDAVALAAARAAFAFKLADEEGAGPRLPFQYQQDRYEYYDDHDEEYEPDWL